MKGALNKNLNSSAGNFSTGSGLFINIDKPFQKLINGHSTV
jgi:hypothetical protein